MKSFKSILRASSLAHEPQVRTKGHGGSQKSQEEKYFFITLFAICGLYISNINYNNLYNQLFLLLNLFNIYFLYIFTYY